MNSPARTLVELRMLRSLQRVYGRHLSTKALRGGKADVIIVGILLTLLERQSKCSLFLFCSGAGASGLGCAEALRERGIDVIVLEAASRLGGRVCTQHVPGVGRIEQGAASAHGWLLPNSLLAKLARRHGVTRVAPVHAGKWDLVITSQHLSSLLTVRAVHADRLRCWQTVDSRSGA
jgi:hypothetical protein